MGLIERTAAALLLGGALLVAQELGDALRAMVESERAFARMSVEKNQRDAFLAFFSDEGVSFSPAPANARESLLKRPVPQRPKARVLDWEPAVASVSSSGDLGYSTGPFTSTDEEAGGKRLAEGWFFSVWKRLPDGDWRVVADLGVGVQGIGTLRPRSLQVIGAPAPPPPTGCPAAETPSDAERLVNELAGERGVAQALAACSTPDTRVYRQGIGPIVGRAAILDALAKAPMVRWQPTGSGISGGGDFAYVYGNAEVSKGAGKAGTAEAGGYLRVWRRLDRRWLLAADVLSR